MCTLVRRHAAADQHLDICRKMFVRKEQTHCPASSLFISEEYQISSKIYNIIVTISSSFVTLRRDPFNCYVNLTFQTQDGNVSAPSLIQCVGYAEDTEGQKNSLIGLIGLELTICYIHSDPTGRALVKAPETFIPSEYKDEYCGGPSYDAAMKCRRRFPRVFSAFIACTVCIPLLWVFIWVYLYKKCTTSLECGRVVLPEKSAEMIGIPENV